MSGYHDLNGEKPELHGVPQGFNPNPLRPKLRIRLDERSPHVDLGVSQSELFMGLIETMALLCDEAGVTPSPRMLKAITNLAELKRIHNKP